MTKIRIARIENHNGIGPFNCSERWQNKLHANRLSYFFFRELGFSPTPIADPNIAVVWNKMPPKTSRRFGMSSEMLNHTFKEAHKSHAADVKEEIELVDFVQQVIDHCKATDFHFLEYEAVPYASSDHQIVYNPRTKKLIRRFTNAQEIITT